METSLKSGPVEVVVDVSVRVSVVLMDMVPVRVQFIPQGIVIAVPVLVPVILIALPALICGEVTVTGNVCVKEELPERNVHLNELVLAVTMNV